MTVVISASRAFSSIEQEILGLRRDEDRLTKMLASATEEASRLRAKETEAYRALARLKLDALARDEIVGRLDSAERAALAALEQRRKALADLADEHSAAVKALAAAKEAHDDASDHLERALDAIEELEAKTGKRLEDDAGWQDLSKELDAAEAKASAAAEKARQSELDRDEKRKPYDNDPLFSYLWKRGYGTANYHANPLVRFFDAKVARLVGYDDARPNYFMLNEIPLRLREHADKLEETAEERRSKLDEYERHAMEADGIAALEAEAKAAEQARTETDAQIAEAETALSALNERQTALVDAASDPNLSAAIGNLAAALAREDLSDLYRVARETATPEDELIVSELREIEGKLIRSEAEAEEVRKAAVDLARKRAELESSRDDFRRSGYDHPRGQFSNGDLIGELIKAVVAGAVSSGALNDALRGGFSTRTTSRRRSSSLGLPGPRAPRPPRSPRPSRGGFRTGGRF